MQQQFGTEMEGVYKERATLLYTVTLYFEMADMNEEIIYYFM